MDSKIINLYRCCRDFPELLAYAVYLTPYSREEHRTAQKGDSIDDLIEVCNRYLVRDYLSHSGYGERANKKGEYNCPFATRMDEKSNKEMVFNSIPDRILTASTHLGSQFNELRESIELIPDETIRQRSQQALDSILAEVQKTLETDLRVEFVRRFLVDGWQSFKGEIGDSWAMAKYNEYDQFKENIGGHQFLPEKLINTSPHLQEISDLKKVYLENDDFEKVCRRWDTPHTLHYLDPPYFDAEHYYSEKFTKDCHQRLCQMVHELEGQVIMSYYPHPEIMSMYSEDDWEFHYKETVASSCGVTRQSKTRTRPKRTELLLVRKRQNTEKAIVNISGQMSLF
jgi:site-specific DNA-adenine methylase